MNIHEEEQLQNFLFQVLSQGSMQEQQENQHALGHQDLYSLSHF